MMHSNVEKADTDAQEDLRNKLRAQVAIECEIRVGTRAWRKARIADLTPEGFQVAIFNMPPRGTPLYVRFAGIQMQTAEVCWSKADTAGCRFIRPLSSYVFDHIVQTAN